MNHTAGTLARPIILTFILLAASVVAIAQPPGKDISPQDRLPFDPAVRTGRLKNGLTYFIRKNAKPEDRAELQLIVKAGSVLETPEQQGLAHFVEHMAFNGTKNFRKHEIVDFLESTGMRFGADLNAYTGFDQTVYMLQLPTDNARTLDKGIQVLEDWAHNVSFEDDEIDKERGVVIEEWRLGRGADSRLRDKTFPVLYYNSIYADRLPIGQKAVLDTFRHETLRRFYSEWYRPELMAVVAVGDFDPAAIEQMIQDHFNRIPVSQNPKVRQQVIIPDHPQTLYAIASDAEATRTAVGVRYLHPLQPTTTVADYRQDIVQNLFFSMLNARIEEISKRPDPPLLFGYGSAYNFNTAKFFVGLDAGVVNNGAVKGLTAVLTEAERVRRYGFSQTELDRAKLDVMRGMEQAYAERDKVESARYADEYSSYFLNGTSSPGIEYESALYSRYMPGITLQEVNAVGKLFTDDNRVVTVTGPRKEGVSLPSESDLAAVFRDVTSSTMTAYIDTVSQAPLMAMMPKGGKIVKETTNSELGTTEWTLSNGMRVILKPTDFKNDQVLFNAFSPGGTSLASDADYLTATFAVPIVVTGGLGAFNETDLNKKLAGKDATVTPYIAELRQGLNGNGSPKDMETMFQLIDLYLTSPRKDSNAFNTMISRLRAAVQNRSARPDVAFNDTLNSTLWQYSVRKQSLSEQGLSTVDLDKAFRFYQARFANPAGLTFIFVGTIRPETMRPLVEKYLAGLSTGGSENWRDLGLKPPTGVIRKEVHRGVEPKSQVAIIFSGPFEWNRWNQYVMDATLSVLEIRMREALREDKGGTYGVGVGASPVHYPEARYTASIGFGCAPDRVAELTKAAFDLIETFKKTGPTKAELEKVKEADRREREVKMKDNQYWLGAIQSSLVNNDNPTEFLHDDRLAERLTAADIKAAAARYLDMKNYIQVLLFPEK
ncbi:MAG: peptidase domain protein [Chlorobi bacterium]|nr:peptidase domain protein [Chlorobiota bacterium]